jgi:hypothetical protein
MNRTLKGLRTKYSFRTDGTGYVWLNNSPVKCADISYAPSAGLPLLLSKIQEAIKGGREEEALQLFRVYVNESGEPFPGKPKDNYSPLFRIVGEGGLNTFGYGVPHFTPRDSTPHSPNFIQPVSRTPSRESERLQQNDLVAMATEQLKTMPRKPKSDTLRRVTKS